MELKVWVDGIQRVVCGASYTTTCQDVVLALAHAMGRTGRFTLVEKWRDAERPLTPGECPLQSLHKWGEYAAEVRYYLVQAETDKAKHQEQTRQRQKMSTEKLDKFTHNFTPPHLGHMGPESIKRSSTFSGAHNMNYAKFPSSLSSSMSATSSYNKQPLAQPQSSSTTKVRHTALGPLPNGEIASASSSSSSPRSSSRSSPGGLSPRSASRSAPYRDDARTLHPANMPGATTSYSNQDRGYSAHKHSTQQSFPAPSQQPYPVPSQQTRQGLSHPPPRSHHPTQSQYPFPNQSHQSHPSSPKQTSSRPQLPISQHHHPSASQGVHSVTSGQAHPSQRHFSQPSHQPYPQSNHSEPPVHPIPAPRQLRASSPDVEYENLPPHPTQRERSRERSSQRTTPVSFPANAGDSSKVFYQEADRDAASRGNNDSHSFHKDGRGNGSSHPHYKKRGESYPYQRGGAPQGYSDNQSSARNTQGRLRSDDAVGHTSNTSSSTVPSFTRDKVVPGPQLSKGLPSRSLSSANTARADEEVRHSGDNLSKSMPESSMKQMRRSGEAGGKLSFVESALMRQQRSSTESTGRGGTMSSFASAVAHIRQHSGDGQLKPPKSETHVRQHSSDSSLTDESFQGGLRASLNRDMSSLGTSTSNQNVALNIDHLQQQKHHHPLPSVNKPSSPLSSISPSRHNSAFTQVSPRTSTSHQGSASSPSSAAPVAYNLDHQNFHHFGPGLPNAAGSRGPGLQQSQENTHSRQASLEIEEYDLDQNFPDVFYRDAAAAGGVKTQIQQSMPLEYHLENGGVAPAQHEAEYTRLVRLVRMQEERIKMQEAQISDCTMEISRLEEQENQESAKLEVITGEVTQLEQQENQVKLELEELDRVEWVNVLDGERKREADIKSQMKSLQEKLDELESQLRQLKEEEERKTQELKAEREKLEDEKKKIEEVERKAATEVSELKEKLTALDKLTQEKEKELANLEGKIQKADTDLKQQEEEAQKIEEELKDENLKDFQAHPVPKEPPPSSVPSSTPVEPPAPISVISAADSGEAILKLLEDRLSPRSPPTSPSADGSSNSVGGMTSAQHTYKSALAAKNPNGVWV